MIFKTDFIPLVEDYDKNGLLTLEAVVRLMENAGSRHSDFAGDSVIQKSAGGKAWVLTDWKVRVENFPEYGKPIHVETWSEKPSSPLGVSRNYVMYVNGKKCAAGTSKWVVLDLETKRLCKIDTALMDAYQVEEGNAFGEEKMEKIQLPDEFSHEIQIPLRRSDIDFNFHVHNLCYLNLALEALPEEEYKNRKFKNFRASYKNAVTENDSLTCRYSLGNVKHVVAFYANGSTLSTLVSFGD